MMSLESFTTITTRSTSKMEYKKLQDFLLNESKVFEKEEDTNPLYYMWGVIKSANGKSEEDIKKDEFLKKLFKKIEKFCEGPGEKYVKKLKDCFTPSEMLLSFKDQPVDQQKEMIGYKLRDMFQCMSNGIKSFNEYFELDKAFKELTESEEMKTVISEI